MSEILKWLEEESNRLAEECHSNADPHKTVNNSFLEGFNYAFANVQGLEQPQLNDNQKALVIWMQENECYNGDPLESISDLFLEGTPSEHFPDLPLSCVEAAYQSLNNQQKIEMVQKYLEQYFEQEEEQ
ncbi:hypothetical protein I6I79_08200 [Enterococcus casseliflavus]|uniref:hypothetical protein n=1 Tax=Enterococcus casseliflavus TaxID=37734 RepID=UPI00191A9BBF|nr:hypothetical protein [Enterococcus casseliflavus]QQU17871.1 hypothetical protein I6I79_08200 [Enterococcus casseliflavus]